MKKPINPKATIFIPTYNGEDYLDDIFAAIYQQKTDFQFEILVIDSGSTDKTLQIIEKYIKKHDNITLEHIDKKDFSHGRVRNYAAEQARGEIVVYITHDAIPSHDRWLYEIVRPFEINDKIVGVMGKQIPRPKCFPLLKYEIASVFQNLGADFGTTVYYSDDFVKTQGVYDVISFYSDANSAARKKFLTSEIPYQNVPYAEDQLLGRDIIDSGYYKAYAPRASVVHSNDLKLREYKSRMFDETMGLRKIGLEPEKPSVKSVVKMMATGISKDWVRTLRDNEYSLKRKIYWLFVNPFFHLEKWRGVRLAVDADMGNMEIFNKNSLEKRREK